MKFIRGLAVTAVLSLTASLLSLALPAFTPAAAHAESAPTEVFLAGSSGAKNRLLTLMNRGDLQERLRSYGISPAEAERRISALTDEEAAELAGAIDRLPAGTGDIGLITAVLLIFFALLLTDVMGFTRALPFTNT